jgi:hypothetical protein
MADVSIAKAQSMESAFERLDLFKLWQTSNTIFFPIKYRLDLIYFLQRFSRLELLYLQSKHDILKYAAAHFNPGQLTVKEVRGLKTKKRVALNEHARRQEAKFWEMMRAAEPGKRCLK